MNALEHRIPPPVVWVVVAACMWLVAELSPAVELSRMLRFGLAAALALPAALLGVLGFRAFGRAKTTIDPLRIDRASTLVVTGIYGVTRNPMYLGLTLLLGAWACALAAPFAAPGALAFAAFITRFQIIPEERILLDMFGEPYAAYRRRVRRWI